MAETTSPTSPLIFRQPNVQRTSAELPTGYQPPGPKFFEGDWYVTHSSLPLWQTHRNVAMKYTAHASVPNAFDQLTTYQTLTSDKQKTIEGVEKPDAEVPGAYNWRGKGWLMVASSHWQCLGHGDEEGGWAFIYFFSTIFTPTGIDIYCRAKGGLSAGMIERIKGSLRELGSKDINEQLDKIFEVRQDW